MNISVIIPTLNEEKRIGSLLQDLQKQSHLPHEIFVIDAFSEDRTKDIVSSFQEVLFHQMTPGVGFQRQKGGEMAKGEILVFLDADTRIDETLLEDVQKFFMADNLQVACPKYYPESGHMTMRLIYGAFNALFKVFEKVSPSGAGSCIITTKKAFTALGGFNGDLQFDDIAYIRKAGRKYGFKQLPLTVTVSDRRFHEYGVVKMLGLYAVLSVLFFFGLFKATNYVNYAFGKYKKN